MRRLASFLLLPGLALGQGLHTFENGQVADAQKINENFNYVLENADGSIVAGSTNASYFGFNVPEGGMTETNRVELTVPSAGVLVVSGSVFVNHRSDAPNYYSLVLKFTDENGTPLVDGGGRGDEVWVAAAGVPAQNDDPGADEVQLSYTISLPIYTGVLYVSQEVGPEYAPTSFFYNANNLTVQYYPQPWEASITDASPSSRSSGPQATGLGNSNYQSD